VEAANVERFGILGHRTAQQSHAQLSCMTTELLGSHGTAGTHPNAFPILPLNPFMTNQDISSMWNHLATYNQAANPLFVTSLLKRFYAYGNSSTHARPDRETPPLTPSKSIPGWAISVHLH
jgi:hypothetical protein